jgi:hypothetical protein
MTGEGQLTRRLEHDWQRYGPDARVRFFAAGAELPLHEFKMQPWHGQGPVKLDKHMRAAHFNLLAALEELVGKFVHLEIEWRK